jgi:hypothetical protein
MWEKKSSGEDTHWAAINTKTEDRGVPHSQAVNLTALFQMQKV